MATPLNPPLSRAAQPVNPVNQYQDRINRQKDQSLSQDVAFWDQSKTDWSKSANNWQGFMLQDQEDRSNLPVGSPEWLAANQATDASMAAYADAVAGVERTGKFAQEARSQIGTGQGWKDHVALDAWSQQRAEQRMAEMRAQRAQRPGGADFVGPLQPRPAPVPPASVPPNVPTGMLVASSNGGVKWQPGTGPGTSLPPQSRSAIDPPSMMPASPPLPFAMPAQRAAYVNTGSGLDRAVSTGLAGAPRRQVGRSANDPTRIAEQMRRRGDARAIMQLGQMQMGQDFARERDAVNFAQGQMMFNQQQQAMDARDARNFDQGVMMFGMQQGAADARDVRNFQQQRQIEAERFMAEQAAQEAARNRVPMMGQVPIPGTNYMGTYADGRYMGNVPMAKPPEPLSFQPVPGTNVMVPRGEGADRIPLMENRGTIESPRSSADTMGPMPGMMDLRPLDQTPSAPRAPQVRRILNAAGQEVDMQWNAQTNQWEPVAMAGGSATGAGTGSTTGAAGTSPLDKLRALRSRTGGQM